MRKFVKGKEGFTLIEIVLVILIIAVLAGILIEPLRQGIQSYVGIETRADLTSQAREATTRMIRELRNIRKDAGNAPEISTADATSITFADVEDNTITFSLSGSTVQRNSNVLADQVSSLEFRYFDGSNAELTIFPLSNPDREKVRRILVILAMQEGTETVTMTGQAFLRELRGL
jgi:prepilin-type N-terminal cleavage/methylation domain-containing protein